MTKKIIYFTAGPTPTSTELAEIAALNAKTIPGYTVAVRNTLESNSYGAGIESTDSVAGTVPTAYNALPNYGVPNALRPAALQALPDTHSMAVAATKQLQVLKATGDDISALVLADVTAVSTTYATSDAAKATVSAGGLVTAVATGTATITATHTYTSGKTITDTMVITVT